MTMYSPILLTNDAALLDLARQNSWHAVRQHPDNDKILQLLPQREHAGTPQPRFSVEQGSLGQESAPTWQYILNWMERYVHRPLLCSAPDDFGSELALWAAADRGWPIAGIVNATPFPMTPQAVALFTAADSLVLRNPDAEQYMNGNWPAAFRKLPHTPLVEIEKRQAPPARLRRDGVVSLLIIAYYAGPSPTVGVQRVNYWFEHVAEISEGRVAVDVACATPWAGTSQQHIHRVPDLGPAILHLSGDSGADFLKSLREEAYAPELQVAGLWHRSLERYFDARHDDYDVVLISGNPFPPFEFIHYAQRRWHARVILDYRDPFALSPRVSHSHSMLDALTDAERGWNMAADAITVVNEACAGLVVPPGPSSPVHVVPNGWDESLPQKPRRRSPSTDRVRLGHAGQVFPITPLDPLASAVSRTTAELHHIGAPISAASVLRVVNHGRNTRGETLRILSALDCGVAYLSSSGIETPTKVFDYLAVGLDLLLLHRGDPDQTALYGLLADAPGVYWVHDDEESIYAWLTSYVPTAQHESERAMRFSRKRATEALVRLVLEMGDHSFSPA